MAVLGWETWDNRATLRQATEAPQTAQSGIATRRLGGAARRRVQAKMEAMQDDRFNWRTVERLAIKSGVDEAEAREILAEHSARSCSGNQAKAS